MAEFVAKLKTQYSPSFFYISLGRIRNINQILHFNGTHDEHLKNMKTSR